MIEKQINKQTNRQETNRHAAVDPAVTGLEPLFPARNSTLHLSTPSSSSWLLTVCGWTQSRALERSQVCSSSWLMVSRQDVEEWTELSVSVTLFSHSAHNQQRPTPTCFSLANLSKPGSYAVWLSHVVLYLVDVVKSCVLRSKRWRSSWRL